MVEREMEIFAERFLDKHYKGMRLKVPVKLNSRLSTTLGRFRIMRDGLDEYSHSIEISKKLVEHNEKDTVYGVLVHELIHYALYEMGLPFDDGEELFESELKKHNAPSTNKVNAMIKRYVYTCGCDKEFNQTRKDGHNYRCGSCKNTLKLKKVVEPKKLVKVI